MHLPKWLRWVLFIVVVVGFVIVALIGATPQGSVPVGVQQLALFITILAGLAQLLPIAWSILSPKTEPSPSMKKYFRVFFILCEDCSPVLRVAILSQNQHQSLFEFELADWDTWDSKAISEQHLTSLATKSKLTFANAFQDEMEKYNRGTDHPSDRANLAITSLNFPQNFYTWNTEDKKGIVIGLRSLSRIFGHNETLLAQAVIRIMQRAVIYSLNIPNLQSHDETRGCLFDFTRQLNNMEYSANSHFICSDCKRIIIADQGEPFFDMLQAWLKNSIN